MIQIQEIREQTKELIKGKRAASGSILLLMIVLMNLTGMIVAGAFNAWPLLANLIVLLVQAPFWFGLYRMFMGNARGQNPNLGDAFSGFSQMGRAIGLIFLKGALLFGITIPLTFLFGQILSSDSQIDALGQAAVSGDVIAVIIRLLIVLAPQLLILLVITWVSYRLVLTERIAIDEPDKSIFYAFQTSFQRMDGHVGKMLLLDLRNQLFFLMITLAWIVVLLLQLIDVAPKIQELINNGETFEQLLANLQNQNMSTGSAMQITNIMASLSGLFLVFIVMAFAYAWVWSFVETSRTVYYDRMNQLRMSETLNKDASSDVPTAEQDMPTGITKE